MNWWDNSLYDTCTIITIRNIILDNPIIEKYFRYMCAIDPSFSHDNMKSETGEFMKPKVTIIDLPPIPNLSSLIDNLSNSLAEVDKYIFATAIYRKLNVVTGDRDLARLLLKNQSGIRVGNCALILKDLLLTKKINENLCLKILKDLSVRKDYIISQPPELNVLRSYFFP